MEAKHNRPVENDDAGRTKAAAWAWYQHGKGGPGNGVVTRTVGAGAVRTPSRFKAEAMKAQQIKAQEAMACHITLPPQQQQPDPQLASQESWDCSSSLFDSYELLSLSRQLDQAFTRAATGTLLHATESEAPKRHTKLGKMWHHMLPRPPRPLCQSEVLTQKQLQLHHHKAVSEATDHKSRNFLKDGYHGQDQDDYYTGYHDGLYEDHNLPPTIALNNFDHHQYVEVDTEYRHVKPWSLRKLSRALLMLTPRPTSVSHHSDDAYSQDFHHQHHHLHHHHHQHEYQHRHEFPHHHHVHHVIHANPKMSYEAPSQPPQVGTGL